MLLMTCLCNMLRMGTVSGVSGMTPSVVVVLLWSCVQQLQKVQATVQATGL